MSYGDASKKFVREYILAKLDEDTQRLARLAWWDLMYGPISTDPESIYGPDDGLPWCGFSEACAKVAEAVDDIGDLWIDGDFVMTSEPEGYEDPDTGEWCEPYLDDTFFFSRKDALAAAFGRELVEYL